MNLATQSLNITGTNGLQTEAKANGIEVKIDTATKNKIDNAANQSLDNINPDGKNVIKGLVDIENGKNTTASSRDVNGVKTFKVDVNTTTISAGNDGQVNTPANGDAPVTATSVADATILIGMLLQMTILKKQLRLAILLNLLMVKIYLFLKMVRILLLQQVIR